MKKQTINEHPSLTRARALCAEHGGTATTPRGCLKFILAKGLHFSLPQLAPRAERIAHIRRSNVLDAAKKGDTVEMGKMRSYHRVAFSDPAQAKIAFTAARENNPRKKNMYIGIAKVNGPAIQEREEAIHYKGKFKGYTGSNIYADYQSCIACSASGKSACIVTGCKLVRRILAPAGMKFAKDAHGILLSRISDGMDYHPTPEDWHAKNFAARVREGMAANCGARLATKRAEKQAARDKVEADRIARFFVRDIPTVRVTLADSRAAGNCVEGSLAFAERKLHIPREEILAGGHLFSVPATRLLAAANGDKPRVEAAIRRAWMRETCVAI